MRTTILITLLLLFSCSDRPGKIELTVQRDKCIACKTCIYACDADAITIVDNKALIDPAKCVECGKCVEVCPNDAIY